MMRALLLALAASTLAATSSIAQAAAQSPPPRPTLVVFIAVDQLRPDYADRWRGQLTGGLRRLWEGGAVMDDAWYDYMMTETAPGHAVMMAGRWPASTGIILNDEGVPDPRTPLIGSKDTPASPYRFRGSVLMDWIRNADPRSRALSVSRKDRGAILPLGHSKPEAFWWSGDAGFTTSRWYADTLPTWVRRFNERHPIAGFAEYTWTPLLADSAYREPDDEPAEASGRGSTFPVRARDLVSGRWTLGDALEYMPVMDSLTVELALAGVQEMNLGAGPQL
ncbi:MAG TPA: alkaline phosphatase family protein, partial [Gemmatimonadaceae bacterium]|nr:alkaline phosphatase family protein [Gemmatimonadaceae bacterium]